MSKPSIYKIVGAASVGFSSLLLADQSINGPSEVKNQIQGDKETTKSHLKGWLGSAKGFKNGLEEEHGFSVASDYAAMFYSSNNDYGPTSSGSGVLRLYGAWDLVNRNEKNAGSLIYKVESRHRYTKVAPNAQAGEMGTLGSLAPVFSNDNVRLTNLYWRQAFADDDGYLTFGFLDTTDYLDFHELGNPWTNFSNLNFITGSGTVQLPNDANFGLMGAYWLGDTIYGVASISDLNADPTNPFHSADYFFSRREYFKSLEVGWTTSRDRVYRDSVSLSFWHVDSVEANNTEDGWGLNFSASQWFNDQWLPFLRGGYTHESSSIFDRSIAAGVGYAVNGTDDMLGFAGNWARPNRSRFGSGLSDQYTFELFYRIQATESLAITPDIQYLINPAQNPKDDSILVAGLRARLLF